MYSKFPDFVYSWFAKFRVDDLTRKVRQSKLDEQDADSARCSFLRYLINPLVDKHWETVTFRQFLEESSSVDEVYFYLYCRSLLFNGAN